MPRPEPAGLAPPDEPVVSAEVLEPGSELVGEATARAFDETLCWNGTSSRRERGHLGAFPVVHDFAVVRVAGPDLDTSRTPP